MADATTGGPAAGTGAPGGRAETGKLKGCGCIAGSFLFLAAIGFGIYKLAGMLTGGGPAASAEQTKLQRVLPPVKEKVVAPSRTPASVPNPPAKGLTPPKLSSPSAPNPPSGTAAAGSSSAAAAALARMGERLRTARTFQCSFVYTVVTPVPGDQPLKITYFGNTWESGREWGWNIARVSYSMEPDTRRLETGQVYNDGTKLVLRGRYADKTTFDEARPAAEGYSWDTVPLPVVRVRAFVDALAARVTDKVAAAGACTWNVGSGWRFETNPAGDLLSVTMEAGEGDQKVTTSVSFSGHVYNQSLDLQSLKRPR